MSITQYMGGSCELCVIVWVHGPCEHHYALVKGALDMAMCGVLGDCLPQRAMASDSACPLYTACLLDPFT